MMLGIVAAFALAGALPSWGANRHQVAVGDHLWGLAGKYYGNNRCWRAIYEANKDLIGKPDLILPKQVLEIPDSPKCPAQAVDVEASSFVPAGRAVTAVPVEASAPRSVPVKAPAATEPAEEEPAVPAEPPARTASKLPPMKKQGLDDLSAAMPEDQTALEGTEMVRMDAHVNWRRDGVVMAAGLVAPGDEFNGRILIPREVPTGAKAGVFRRDAPRYSDRGKNALFLQRIATVEVVGHIKGQTYRFVVRKAGSAVQSGDMIKLEP